MSSDPKPLSKPWMATEMPFLQQYRQKTFEDGDKTGGYAKYSELQRPYLYDENVPPEYIWWEFIWPDINFPDIPTVPDTPPSECSVDEDCVFAKIIGSGTMNCGECKTWSQFHYWVGCTIAPWWAAFGSWRLEGGVDGECEMTSSGPVMATVCCSSVASPQTLTLIYDGPLGCVDSMEVVVYCEEECCAEFEITGNNTVNAGSTWTGTISPACPGATCEVTSNSGCSLSCAVNGAGSQVTVTPGGSDCGSFTVTVTASAEGCDLVTASFGVMINGGGGAWTEVINDSEHLITCPTDCNTGCGTQFSTAPCYFQGSILGQTAYWKVGHSWVGGDCQANFYAICSGCRHEEGPDHGGNCVPTAGTMPPCGSTQRCDTAPISSGYCAWHSIPGQRDCVCTKWYWDACQWICSC